MLLKQRNQTVDLLRGIAALCMILGHSFIAYPVDISDVQWCVLLKRIIYTFHMELFFILSGWVYKCNAYPSFVRKKATRLLVPYFTFGIISMVLHVFGGDAVNGGISLTGGIVDLLLYGGDYWFIYTLFLILAVYPLLDMLMKRPWMKPVTAAVILLLDSFVAFPSVFALNAVVKYIPYFILGDWVGKSGYAEKQSSSGTGIALAVGGVAVYAVLYALEFAFAVQIGNILTFVRAVAFCAALYSLCSIKVASTGFAKAPRWLLENASRYSLQFYLFNGYFLTAIRIVMCSLLHIESPILLVSGIWIGDVVLTLFICKVILPKSKLFRFVCGV